MNTMKAMLVLLSAIMVLLSNDACAGTYMSSAHGVNINRQTIDAKYSGYATGNCAHCHEAHASLGGSEPAPTGGPDQALAFNLEENLCETCHDGNPAADNIMAQIDKANAHPTDDYSGRHSISENTTTNMTPGNYADGASRHAECADCHNPHAAGTTVHTAGTNAVTSSSPLYMVSGVEPAFPAGTNMPVPSGYTEIPASTGISKEYQLCFKCHSDWTTQPAAQTNIAQHFNSNNLSFHPVMAVVPATRVLKTTQLTAAWVNVGAQTMYCSDCHGSETTGDPAGPHGSTISKVLKGRWPRNSSGTLWVLNDGKNNTNNFNAECLCYQCHGATNLNRVHAMAMNVHNFACVICHVGLPHGYINNCLIAFTTDPAPYNYANMSDVNRFVQRLNDGSYASTDCGVPVAATCTVFPGAHPLN